MIDSRHLSILREVERQGSVTAAADKLNVSQSALSHTVRKLEERYGIKIWEKQGRSLRFTQAGQYLLSLSERVLPQLEHAETELYELASGMKGVLRVGMECHPCQNWLMKVTDEYLSNWPDVSFHVRTAFPYNGVDALHEHEIDLLITPDPILHNDLNFTPVFDYELVLAVNKTHPLSSKTFLEPKDLLNEELITIPVSKDRLDIFIRFLAPSRCEPKRHTTVETIELILQLVAADRGVAVLPDWLVNEMGDQKRIHTLKLGMDGLYKSINIGCRKGEEHIDYIKGFISTGKSVNK